MNKSEAVTDVSIIEVKELRCKEFVIIGAISGEMLDLRDAFKSQWPGRKVQISR